MTSDRPTGRPRHRAPLAFRLLAAVFAHEVPDGWAAAGIALPSAGLTGVALWGLWQPAQLGDDRRGLRDRLTWLRGALAVAVAV